MPREQTIARHTQRYQAFLKLFPKSHHERFAEPMLQTFVDMCNERLESGAGMNRFVLGIYLDTTKEIIKERSKEVVMNLKTRRSKVFIGGGVAGLLLIAATAMLIINGGSGGSIPIFSTVEEARAISKGKKDRCLPDVATAKEAIEKDDYTITHEYEGVVTKTSSFETYAVSGFRDIPAGANGDVTKYSYDGVRAKGSISYEQDYGTYNYEIKRLPEDGKWELVSLSACEM
jgi:hypothetical protein